jgi:hypothetical protein
MNALREEIDAANKRAVARVDWKPPAAEDEKMLSLLIRLGS